MENQFLRRRLQSARERPRPLSSRPQQDRTESIKKVYYNNFDLLQRPSSGRKKTKINFHSKASHQQKQVLIEQNILLKKKVNMMEMQLSQLNVKMIATREKAQKNNKFLDMKFLNKTLLTGKQQYLVTGIKNQYEKLKVQHKKKCDELEKVEKTPKLTNIKELHTAYDRLQTYSKDLLNKYHKLEVKNNILSNQSLQGNTQSQRNYQICRLQNENLSYTLDERAERLQQKRQQISYLNKTIQLNENRIKFYEHFVQQKEKQIYVCHKKNKQLESSKQCYLKEIQALRQKIVSIEMQNQFEISKIREEQQRKADGQRIIYKNIISERDKSIQKLEKEMAYLTTLISYWKPLDEERRQHQTSINKINNWDEKKADDEKNRKSLNECLGQMSKTLSQRPSQQNTKARIKTEIQAMEKPRQQKRADVKRSDESKKVRPVGSAQVEQIGELLRFRLIAKCVSINDAKDLFSGQVQIQNFQDVKQHIPWQSEYITMRSANNILMSEPFNLTQSQALLLSRYLIEDVQNEYVYCAWDNENNRQVVKSILKSTIKDYDIQESLQQIQAQTQIQLEKYRQRISLRLKQQYKDGTISKKRLIDIIGGNGFQLSQPVVEFIIGKLAVKSESLERLNYSGLF